MGQPDHERLNEIYTRLQSQALPEHRVGYEDKLQQALYLEILTAIGFPPTATVLDVGCGYGDLYAYLLNRGYKGYYVGIDLMPHFIEQARQRFPEAHFVLGDMISAELEPCDYALASGLFDYHTPNIETRWSQTIHRMFELARCGIAWNGLTARLPGRVDLWPQPLPRVLDLCANLSPYYSIRCDYDPLHFTACVYKRKHYYTDELHRLVGHLYFHPDYAQMLRDDPFNCAAKFGVSLQQLNVIAGLWAIDAPESKYS